MDSLPELRLDYIDIANAELLEASLQRAKSRAAEFQSKIRSDATSITQKVWSGATVQPYLVAMDSYALGYPLADVRKSLSLVATYYLRVFELRGTGHYTQTSTRRNRTWTETLTDFGTTSSQRAFDAICIALSASEFDIARDIARRTEDPPKASYLGPTSETCTPNQQRVSYALRNLVLGDVDQVEPELDRLFVKKPKKEATLADQADMIRGLATRSVGKFLTGLDALLFRHEKEARRPRVTCNPELFLCLPALGLSSLALQLEVCRREDLPPDNPFLPLEILVA